MTSIVDPCCYMGMWNAFRECTCVHAVFCGERVVYITVSVHVESINI